MDIKIRDKVFRIELVNNMATNLYREIKTLSLQMVDYVNEVKEITQEYEEKAKDIDRKERRLLMKEYRAELLEMKEESESWERDIQDKLDLMMNELLIHNGYEYDKDWWLHKTSQEDKEKFWLDCMKKDAKEEKKTGQKKKKSSTKID